MINSYTEVEIEKELKQTQMNWDKLSRVRRSQPIVLD